MKTYFILLVLLAVIAGCSSTDPNYDQYYDSIKNADVKAAISTANEWKFTAPKITSFVDQKQLKITFPDGRIVTKDLPQNEFYVAIAPYIDFTHSCQTHYPSSCTGEQTSAVFSVIITDDSGTQYVNSNIQTMKNGFFELWLPRNKTFNIHVAQNSKSVDGVFATNSNSNTCITTLRLK